MHPVLEILIRAVLSFIALFLIAELLGTKQISQLTFFDYIVGITVGSVAATMAIDDALPIWYGMIVIGVLAVFTFAIDILCRKSIWARRIFYGRSYVLISEGKILYNELKSAKFTVNDLLRELRSQGYFNVGDIQHAILETNGLLSALAKTAKRPVNTEDLKLNLPDQGLCANVVIDGKIMEDNLRACGKDTKWLRAELQKQNIALSDALLCTLDKDANLSAYVKTYSDTHRTVLQ